MTYDGIHFNIPEAEYRSAPGICQTDLKEMGISPAHYYSKISGERPPPTDAQIIGKLTHSLVLEGVADFVTQPDGFDGRTKDGKEWTAKQTKPVLKSEIARNIRGMAESVQAHIVAKSILSRPGNNEVSCWNTHIGTSLLLKGRADRVTTDNAGMTVIVDLKTCARGDGDNISFAKSIYKYGYHRQAQFYLNLFGASFFAFIVVEKEPPYAVACYNLSAESIALGKLENERDLVMIKRCIAENHWPAYSETMTTIGVPEWALRRELC